MEMPHRLLNCQYRYPQGVSICFSSTVRFLLASSEKPILLPLQKMLCEKAQLHLSY